MTNRPSGAPETAESIQTGTQASHLLTQIASVGKGMRTAALAMVLLSVSRHDATIATESRPEQQNPTPAVLPSQTDITPPKADKKENVPEPYNPCAERPLPLATKEEFIAAIPKLVERLAEGNAPEEMPADVLGALKKEEAEKTVRKDALRYWQHPEDPRVWYASASPDAKMDNRLAWKLTCYRSLNCKDGKPGDPNIHFILRNVADPATCALLKQEDVYNKDYGVMVDLTLQRAMKSAAELRANEKADAAGMKTFDLPKNRKIGLIILADTSDKSLIAKMKPCIEAWPEILSKRYQIVQPDAPVLEPGKFGRFGPDGIKRRMQDQMSELSRKGCEDIIIRIYAHGDATGFLFGGDEVTAAGLISTLTEERTEQRFLVEPISCHGGGMSKMFRLFKDHPKAEPGRVTGLLQTKPDNVGFGTQLRMDGKLYVLSSYDAKMAQLLLSNRDMTYGAMHLEADAFAKQVNFVDAEGWRMQPGKDSLYTAEAQPARTQCTEPFTVAQGDDRQLLFIRKEEDDEVPVQIGA